MSSSNLEQIAFITELIYGETPVAGNFEKARFTSESLSGTPDTTESQQIRTDRLSSGQVVTGLTVGGDINFELAKEDSVDKFFESALMSTWVTSNVVNIDMTLDAALKTLTRAAGDFAPDVRKGDIIVLSGFANAKNNVPVMAVNVTALIITYVGPDGMESAVGAGTAFKRSDYVEIEATKNSFSMEKKFLDLTDKAIVYTGMLASGMSLNIAYGEIATGTFSFNGNGYTPVDAAADHITDGRVLNDAATTNSMNGSVDMPFIANSATGVLEESTFCIQSIEMTLANNLTPQNCIGEIAAKDYSPGTAQIGVSIGAYLANTNWSLLAKKISQEPFEVGFMVKNIDGFYGFYMPAVQVSFDDPSSPGQNQDIILSMAGTAKVGASGEKSLRVFRS